MPLEYLQLCQNLPQELLQIRGVVAAEETTFLKGPEPRPLAFRELPGMSFDRLDRFLNRGLSLEILEEFPVPERLGGGRLPAAVRGISRRAVALFSKPVPEPLRFLKQPGVEHGIDTAIDTIIQDFPGRIKDEDATIFPGDGPVELLLPAADRDSCGPVDLQGADETPGVVRVQPFRSGRIDLPETVVEPAGIVRIFVQSGLPEHVLTKIRIGRGPLEQPAQEPFEIKRGPAEKEGSFAARFDVTDGFGGVPEIIGQGVFPVRIEKTDEVVRNESPLPRRRCGGPDFHTPIQGHRIHGDDFGPDFQGQGDPEGRFPGCRRPCQIDREHVSGVLAVF